MPERFPSAQKFSHEAMGTIFEIFLCESDVRYAGEVSQAVFDEIDRLENLFSRFNPTSQIGQLNQLQPGHTLPISVEVFECLKEAYSIQDSTQGAFDINFGMSGEKGSLWPIKPVALRAEKHGFYVDYLQREPLLQTAGLDFDLGGIGKGFALDRAMSLLSDWSIDNALLHSGTSTALARGDATEDALVQLGWPVGVGGHWPALRNFRIFLRSRALSGSGTEVKGAHIVDPRSGKKASGCLAAWVSHPSATVADALSTAFMVMASEEIAEYCKKDPDTWALLLIDPRRYQVYNKNLVRTQTRTKE